MRPEYTRHAYLNLQYKYHEVSPAFVSRASSSLRFLRNACVLRSLISSSGGDATT